MSMVRAFGKITKGKTLSVLAEIGFKLWQFEIWDFRRFSTVCKH